MKNAWVKKNPFYWFLKVRWYHMSSCPNLEKSQDNCELSYSTINNISRIVFYSITIIDEKWITFSWYYTIWLFINIFIFKRNVKSHSRHLYETTSHTGPKVEKKTMFFCNTSLISRIFFSPRQEKLQLDYHFLEICVDFTKKKSAIYILISRKFSLLQHLLTWKLLLN